MQTCSCFCATCCRGVCERADLVHGDRKCKRIQKKQQKPSAEEKQELVKEIGARMRQRKENPSKDNDGSATNNNSEDSNLLDKLNPFKAGQKLRQSIDTALTSISTEQESSRAMYYLDDRLLDGSSNKVLNERSLSERMDQDDYIPEVLVIGATGAVGRQIVRKLAQLGNCQIRVLVRNLYTSTLNVLGAGVTYCQGDLHNIDSLEYALTDVDKIVFCANPPRSDEAEFQRKFQEYWQETSTSTLERSARVIAAVSPAAPEPMTRMS